MIDNVAFLLLFDALIRRGVSKFKDRFYECREGPLNHLNEMKFTCCEDNGGFDESE